MDCDLHIFYFIDLLLILPFSKRTEVPIIATVIPGILTAFFAALFDLQELVEMMSIGKPIKTLHEHELSNRMCIHI